MTASNSPRIRFECANPILRVENMQASLRFYVDALGFQNASWGNEDFTSITRDGAGIYLCRGGQGHSLGRANVNPAVSSTPTRPERIPRSARACAASWVGLSSSCQA